MTDIVPFSIAAELPRGRLAIEASAGTGKTYALAGLAARYVVEAEVPIGELLVVTFTRAAAAELRDRVRARLVDAADALASNIDPDDEVLAVLCDVPDDERARRLLLAQRAVSDFDSATITTIHGFAQQVLGSLGTSVPTDPDAVLVDDTPALIAQVATDLLTAEAVSCRHPAEDLPKHPKLVAAARLALGNPAAQLVPDADDPDLGGDAALRRRLVDTIADEVDRRRRASGSLSFDDLLVRLRAALDDPDRGAAARHALRRRYRIALIDEFQDTDPVQWAIFDAVFGARDADSHDGGPTPTLVLVGDPKQAIYAFRGADVHTYLDAAHAPGTDLCGLTTNWRSDAAYLTALELLLEGTTFGDDRIAFHHVDHAERNAATRIVDGNGDPLPTLALRLAAGDIDRHSRRPKIVLTEAARDAVHHDLAVYIRDLLEDAWLPGRTDDDRPRPLQPDDIAVLVATGAEGPEVRAALERVGVPAVMARGDNVLTSAAATQWHLLLSALARPADVRRARAVAVSWFVGWTGDELAAADDDAIADLHATLHRWADVLAGQGLATLLGTLRAETGVAARVLARSDGDRAMTDLDHVAELLQLAAPRRVSPAMLLATFEQLAGGDDEGDPEADLAARRVESESRAVQIMTTHVAKGLEFEVVCCPSLSHATPVKKAFVDPVRWDPDGHRRIVDVAGDVTWPDADTKAARTEQALAEAIGSNLRVLYVALTRARHHTALWWAPTDGAAATGLARVLFARDADGRIDPATFTGTGAVATPDGEDAVTALAPLVDRSDGRIAATLVHRPDRRPRRWAGGAAPTTAELQAATLGRRLDRRAGRWSFTAITARAHEDHDVGIDPLDDTVGDAADADELIPPDERPDGLPTGVASAHDRTSVAETPAAAGPDAGPDGLPSDGPAQLALSFDADTGSDVGDTDVDTDATPPDGDR
ncbi:MAG: UvrD-helicase domain-containing protein, partial [Acidimicrobiales bacterium]|nr:UvrD-helicase domain-containing protein [Acidimicrobiales bacterium]